MLSLIFWDDWDFNNYSVILSNKFEGFHLIKLETGLIPDKYSII